MLIIASLGPCLAKSGLFDEWLLFSCTEHENMEGWEAEGSEPGRIRYFQLSQMSPGALGDSRSGQDSGTSALDPGPPS